MIRLVCCTVAVLLLGACSGSNAAMLGKYGEACSGAMSCGSGLDCIAGLNICTIKCTASTQCAAFGAKSICSNGYCYDQCQDMRNCPNGLSCVLTSATLGICKPLL